MSKQSLSYISQYNSSYEEFPFYVSLEDVKIWWEINIFQLAMLEIQEFPPYNGKFKPWRKTNEG